MMYFRQQIDDLYRRMFLVIGRGKVNAVNDDTPCQMMQVGLNVNEIRDNTPRMGEYGFTSNPPPGSDCITAFLGGDRSQGCVIATGNNEDRPKGLLPGESMVYSHDGKYIHFTANGDIIIECNNQNLRINNANDVIMNANLLLVTGMISAEGDIRDNVGDPFPTNNSMRHFRDVYNTHTHGGVQAGGGDTAVPNQTDE